MNFKDIIKKQPIEKYFYALLILANLAIIFWIGIFINKYVYQTIFVSTDSMLELKTKTVNDINIPKFEAVIKKIKLKSESKQPDQVKNIFE